MFSLIHTRKAAIAHWLMPHCAMVAPVWSLTLLHGSLANDNVFERSADPASMDDARLRVGEEGWTGAVASILSMGANVAPRDPVEGDLEWYGEFSTEDLRRRKKCQNVLNVRWTYGSLVLTRKAERNRRRGRCNQSI